MTKVLSLGGSIVAPDGVDSGFVAAFRERIVRYLKEDDRRRVILVVGGGAPARRYQEAYRSVVDNPDDATLDLIGIAATRLNAELLRSVFAEYCSAPVVQDPSNPPSFTRRVLVGAGWKPGFSTDFDAVVLAERFHADTVVNLSNIAKVYTADPKVDPTALPLDRVTWAEFRRIVGDRWVPGKNVPFDPVASQRAAELHLRVIAAAGRDLDNVDRILRDSSYAGTTIGPE